MVVHPKLATTETPVEGIFLAVTVLILDQYFSTENNKQFIPRTLGCSEGEKLCRERHLPKTEKLELL